MLLVCICYIWFGHKGGSTLTKEQEAIPAISDRIVKAQEPIRVLDAIKWDDSVMEEFFADKCKKLSAVDENYYAKYPSSFDPDDKITEFHEIVRDAKNQLGEFLIITRLMERRCGNYCKSVRMLAARGTKQFSELSMGLYGRAHDVFYPGGPRLCDLDEVLGGVLYSLSAEMKIGTDEKKYSAKEAKTILQERLPHFSSKKDQVKVVIDDTMIADAAAGADSIKMNPKVRFSERDLKYLEVHEGWIHIGTTINGTNQPYCIFCIFLSKGSPACSVTQEGLAVVTEVFTFFSYPVRMLKVTNLVKAIDLVTGSADFIETFWFFKDQGYSDVDSYSYASRVFRGSAPTLGSFTKDLPYSKGFILIYNYIRLAVQQNLIYHIPMFFVGKLLIEEIHDLLELSKQGLVEVPIYMPSQFKDLSALSAWMCFSVFLNKFDLETVAKNYRFILWE